MKQQCFLRRKIGQLGGSSQSMDTADSSYDDFVKAVMSNRTTFNKMTPLPQPHAQSYSKDDTQRTTQGYASKPTHIRTRSTPSVGVPPRPVSVSVHGTRSRSFKSIGGVDVGGGASVASSHMRVPPFNRSARSSPASPVRSPISSRGPSPMPPMSARQPPCGSFSYTSLTPAAPCNGGSDDDEGGSPSSSWSSGSSGSFLRVSNTPPRQRSRSPFGGSLRRRTADDSFSVSTPGSTPPRSAPSNSLSSRTGSASPRSASSNSFSSRTGSASPRSYPANSFSSRSGGARSSPSGVSILCIPSRNSPKVTNSLAVSDSAISPDPTVPPPDGEDSIHCFLPPPPMKPSHRPRQASMSPGSLWSSDSQTTSSNGVHRRSLTTAPRRMAFSKAVVGDAPARRTPPRTPPRSPQNAHASQPRTKSSSVWQTSSPGSVMSAANKLNKGAPARRSEPPLPSSLHRQRPGGSSTPPRQPLPNSRHQRRGAITPTAQQQQSLPWTRQRSGGTSAPQRQVPLPKLRGPVPPRPGARTSPSFTGASKLGSTYPLNSSRHPDVFRR